MTDAENMISKEWYWGELRSASENGRIERAWALIAAWPPELEPDAALRYLVRALAQADDNPEILVETGWMLEYYRALPVPMILEPLNREQGWEQELYEREIPLYHPWEGQVLRFREEGRLMSGYSNHIGVRNCVITEAGLPLALETWARRAPDGLLQVSLQGATTSRWSEGDLTPRGRRGIVGGEGVEAPPGESFGGHMIDGWGIATIKGVGSVRRAASLLRRCSRELDALADGGLELAWPPDLLERLRAEGPDHHPDLRYVTGPDPLPPESQVPASAIREATMAGPVGVLTTGVMSWRPNDEIRAHMTGVTEALREAGSDLTWTDALHLEPMSLEQVLGVAGCSPDSEAGRVHAARWQATQDIRPQLTALRDAMRAEHQRRRAEGPAAARRFVRAETPEETYGEEVVAIARELMAADWAPPLTAPEDIQEASRWADIWNTREEWAADDPDILDALTPRGPLLERLAEAAERHALATLRALSGPSQGLWGEPEDEDDFEGSE